MLLKKEMKKKTYVRSQGRLKTLSQLEHFLLMSIGGAFFLRRAMDRLAPSSAEPMLKFRLRAFDVDDDTFWGARSAVSLAGLDSRRRGSTKGKGAYCGDDGNFMLL